MSNIKIQTIPVLGLQNPNEHLSISPISRLGLVTNQLDYEDSFTAIDLKKVKLLINDLSDSGYFKINEFDSKKYSNQIDFKNYITQKELEEKSIKKDNTYIPQKKIPFDSKKTKEQLEQEIEELNYFLLAKSISVNTTKALIDNYVFRNGHNININYDKKSVTYGYEIYYEVTEGVITRVNSTIEAQKKYTAILLNSSSAETLIFFLKKAFVKKEDEDSVRNIATIIKNAILIKFKTELEKTTNVDTLVFLYNNLPNYIKLGYDDIKEKDQKPYKLSDDLLWKHLNVFVNYDEGSSDASYYVLYVMSMISPKFLMQKFLKDQSLVVKIYNGLDDQSGINEFFGFYDYSKTFSSGKNTFEPTNKDYFVTLLNAYIQLHEGDREAAVFESSGAHFHQGTKYGGKFDPEITYRLDSNIVFSNDKKDKVSLTNYWESTQYLGPFFNQQGGVDEVYEYGRGYNESGDYNPLDVVKFTQYNDKGEAITLNVPAIFVKHASDIKEWEKVNEGIRLGVNIIVIVASVATIYSGVSSVFLLAALADIGLASTDIIIQSEKDTLKRSDEGKEFLESWEKIYVVGGIVTFSPVAIKAIAIYAPKILSSGAELLQVSRKIITNPEVYKKVKDLTTKAIHCLEIPNFNKTGLEILKKGFTEFAALKNAEKLQELGVIFAKGAEDSIVAIYKGAVIAYGKAEIVALQLKKALNKLRGKELEKYLDELEELAGMAENIRTTKNVDLFLASAARLESLNITVKNALKYLDEALPHFNHQVIDGIVEQISNTNCVNVVQVVEEYLRTGKIIKAINSERQLVIKLSSKYGGSFIPKTIPEIGQIMKEGERGIIYGIRQPVKNSHVFNVIKIKGELRLLDGQIGLVAEIRQQGYVSFQYLKVN